MENKKYKNKLIYLFTIVVVIIVYLIIHIYGRVVRKDIYLENKGYENNLSVPPVNSIISKENDQTDEIDSLSFARKNVSIKIGDTAKLIVSVNPASLASTKFTWESSNPSVVSVDSDGNIKGLKEGTAIITVTSPNGKTATVKITVVKDDIKVKKIVLNPTSLSLRVGSAKQVKATVDPENATNGDLKWSSSNPKVATVDENGVIKGISPGTTTITVKTKDGTVTTKITVTVKAKEKVDVKVGGTKQIDPNTILKPDNVSNKDLVYESSNPNVATVDDNGKVTGVGPGTTTITIKTKDGEIIDTITVVVKEKDIINVKVGGTKQIDPNTITKPDNVSNKDLVYESSNPNVATVDNNGKVTGVNPGTTTITVKTKDGEIVDTITVVVKEKDIINVDVGSTKQIDPNTITKPDNVSNNDLVYESSNPNVATVDDNGKVTGVNPGTTTITVKTKDGEIIDTITIVVKDKITVEVGEKEQIDPNTITKPDNVTNNDLVYESNNPNVATVDDSGKVTGVNPGTTTITVKTKDGDIIDTITVVVEPKSTPSDDIVFEYDYDSGNYIDLYNQFPIKDEVGKNLQGDKHTQDFKLRFNSSAVGVKYTITMEKLDGSDMEESWAKAYLVRDGVGVNNCLRTTGRVKTFNEYANYKGNPKEKILYEGTVTSAMATRGYEEYTFRMWVSEDVKVYNEDFLSKTFKTRINVYAQENE